MIYLAAPYSHPEPSVREQRFRAACIAAARLIRAGHVIFSPISHGHPIAAYGLPTDWWFWERHDREQLAQCDEVVVLTLDGWRKSVGVQAEIRIAGELGKPVRYLTPDGGDVSPTLAHTAKEARL
jgi:nucleoside 2-deoxyribosyltransferase